jgi:hypothetical protein
MRTPAVSAEHPRPADGIMHLNARSPCDRPTFNSAEMKPPVIRVFPCLAASCYGVSGCALRLHLVRGGLEEA